MTGITKKRRKIMKKSIRYASLFAIVLTAMLIIPLFASCSSSGAMNDRVDLPADMIGNESFEGGASLKPEIDQDGTADVSSDRKIIRTYTVDGETKVYDETIASLNTSIAAHGGYIGESKVTGASYDYSGSKYSRQAYFSIKIPAENLDAFISQVGNMVNVTSSYSNQQDVSESYYSIEARIKTLETERDSLLAMMASIDTAKDYDFWYTLQKKISETEQQIAEYQAVIRTYDGQVAYSTVNLTLREVIEFTQLEEEEPTFFERISNAFTESWTAFGEGCMDLAVFFVYAFPTLLVIAAIPATLLIIITVISKKNRKKREGNK